MGTLSPRARARDAAQSTRTRSATAPDKMPEFGRVGPEHFYKCAADLQRIAIDHKCRPGNRGGGRRRVRGTAETPNPGPGFLRRPLLPGIQVCLFRVRQRPPRPHPLLVYGLPFPNRVSGLSIDLHTRRPSAQIVGQYLERTVVPVAAGDVGAPTQRRHAALPRHPVRVAQLMRVQAGHPE